MTAYPAWTPAARPGIIPLHPLSFGTILGRSFAALRQNPRVLLGFALVVQSVGTFLGAAGIIAITIATFVRLDTLQEGTEEFETVMAGSIAITTASAIVISLAIGALGVIVQGIVVSEVAHAVVAEKLGLAALWKRVKPVAWRLIGYTALVTLAALVAIGILAASVITVAVASAVGGIVLGILLFLAAIPVTLWLTVKLLLAPAAIILERATITQAIARSWSLTRGRFWPALGIVVIISAVFGTIAQVVGLPFSFGSTALTTLLTPTGDPDVGAIIALLVGGVLTQIVTVLVQSVALIVQSTATALLYIDARMRREGLDLDLLAHVERRDAGGVDLPDPYVLHVGRAMAPRIPLPAYGYPYGVQTPQAAGYPAPTAVPGFPAFPSAFPNTSAPFAAPAAPPPPPHDAAAPAQSETPVTVGASAAGSVPRTATQWTAPGTPTSDPDRESP